MPKKSRVPVARRREWLERYERGEWYEAIATEDKVNTRTVREGIEKARTERNFESAQREQLREALIAHQRDMLALMDRIQQLPQVLPVEFMAWGNRDFGLESLEPLPRAEDELDVPFYFKGEHATWGQLAQHPKTAWLLKRGLDGPSEVVLGEEHTPLWKALKEHTGSKDSLWRHLAEWRTALLAEVRARAVLNRQIMNQAERLLEAPVLQLFSDVPHLTAGLVTFVRVEVTNRVIGNTALDLSSWIPIVSGNLESSLGRRMLLVQRPTNPDEARMKLVHLVEGACNWPQAIAVAQTYRDLENRPKKVRDDTEGYRLLHHIPGQCNLCKKLAGQ